MTLARVLLEIRRLAASAPHDMPRVTAIERAARQVIDALPSGPRREFVAGLLGIGKDRNFDASILDALTPETILRLDMLASDFLELTYEDAMSALDTALIRPSHH